MSIGHQSQLIYLKQWEVSIENCAISMFSHWDSDATLNPLICGNL